MSAAKSAEPPFAHSPRLISGATFALEAAAEPEAVWGKGQQVLWSKGEPVMFVAPQGVGKTTLSQQLILGRIGIRRNDLLGFPIEQSERVLYIAADRPRQAARSLRRMVEPRHAEKLENGLVVHQGPLPFDLVTHPDWLAAFAKKVGADTVVIDSLKDVARRLSEDDPASAVNLAYQYVIAEGIELVVLHHQRKASGDNKRPTTLDDVYGNTWLTAGLGSVVLLWGKPGDLLVELHHLKQPAEDVGPLKLLHDHTRGVTTVHQGVDLEAALANGGLTAKAAAVLLFGRDDPDANLIEKGRRRLDNLVDRGVARKIPPPTPNDAARYMLRQS